MSTHKVQNKAKVAQAKPKPKAAQRQNRDVAQKMDETAVQASQSATTGAVQRARLMRQMQGMVGNGRVSRLMEPQLQTKMTVNAPNDKFEKEAEATAATVMRHSRMPPADEDLPDENASEPLVQRKGQGVPDISPATEKKIQGMRGGGQPLPPGERQFFEKRMGADFGNVRVHTDGNAVQAARAIHAKAFTTGSDIAFDAGAYQPGTKDGRSLLAHELTHTMQQGAVRRLQRQPSTDTAVALTSAQKQPETAEEKEVPAWKRPLISLARSIPGYKLLSIILGKDPLLGVPVPRTPMNIIQAFLDLVPGGGLLFKRLQESGAVQQTVEWLQAELEMFSLSREALTALLSQIWSLMKETGVGDVVGSFFGRETSLTKIEKLLLAPGKRLLQFAAVVGQKVLQFAFEGVLRQFPMGEKLIGILRSTGKAITAIFRDPVGFAGNLLTAVQLGFGNFRDNIGQHLQAGFIGWLTGSLGKAGITLPEKFDLKGIFSLVTQILGLSLQMVLGKLGQAVGVDLVGIMGQVQQLISVYQQEGLAGLAKMGMTKLLGEEKMAHLMKVWQLFTIVQTGGIAALWDHLKQYLSGLKEQVFGQIRSFITKKVIKAGIVWLLSLFNPASAFFKAAKMMYDVVMFFVEQGKQMMALVNAVVGSLANIAAGNLGSAAKYIEQTLARGIPVAIGFLASLLGLGDVGGRVQKIIKKVHGVVDAALDKLFNSKPVQAVAGFIKKIIGKVKGLAKAGVAKVKSFAKAGIKKAKGVLGFSKGNRDAKTKAKSRIQEITKQPFASEKELKAKVISIECELESAGLNSLTVEQKEKTSQYNIIARQPKPQNSKPVNVGNALVNSSGSSASLGFSQGDEIHYREKDGKGVAWDLANVKFINTNNLTVSLLIKRQRINAVQKELEATKPFNHFLKGKTWKNKDGGVEEQIRVKEAISKAGGVVELLKNLSAGDDPSLMITRQELAKLWDENELVKELIKIRFRAANKGNHEWITCEMIIQALDRTAGAEFGAEAINWVMLQHNLRTDTSWVIFHPNYSLTSSTSLHEGGEGYDLMNGHPGALYIHELDPRTGGRKKKELSAKHGEWNTHLVRKFNDIKRLKGFIRSLRTFFGYTVWDGKSAPANLSPFMRDSAENIIDRSTLTAKQSKHYKNMEEVFSQSENSS